jgi:hypothetical protein
VTNPGSSTKWRWPALIFFSVLLLHLVSPVTLSGDSRWSIFVAHSLIAHGDTNLDEYLEEIQKHDYYSVECVRDGREILGADMGDCAGGHIYNWYPIGPPLIAAPFVFLMEQGLQLADPLVLPLAARPGMPVMVAGFLSGDIVAGHPIFEEVIASFLVALTSLVLYFLALRDLPPLAAAGVSFLFAFATSAWSTGSRAMFQHTPSMLLLVLTLFFLNKPRLAAWAGLTASFAYVVRPTNGLLLVGAAVYILLQNRRSFFAFCGAALPVLACFAVYNLTAFGHLRPFYYSLTPPLPDIRFLKALAGNLISPGRGLFVYTPVLLFSLWGMILAWRTRWQWPQTLLWFSLIVCHWIAISLFTDTWWGGHSYGPRLFLDMVPLFVLFLIPVFRNWSALPVAARGAFLAAVLVSFAIHARGATSMLPHAWSVIPNNIDEHPERIWDWKDAAFLR